MKTSSRNIGLDIARALAILLVLVDHSKFFFTPHFTQLNYLSVCSYYGVELFFVLSGYLIGHSLLKQYFQGSRFGFHFAVHFWKRRWLRTLPNYFLVLFVLLLMGQEIPNKVYTYFLFIQNFYSRIPSFYAVSWSLSIEEWFYLLLPLLLILGFNASKKPLVRKGLVVFSLLCYLLLFIGIRSFSTFENWNLDLRQVLLYRLDAVGYGVCLALLKLFKPDMLEKLKMHLFGFGALILMVNLYVYYLVINHLAPIWISKNLIFINTSLGFTFLLPSFIYLQLNLPKKLVSVITFISVSSYAMYLVNYDIVLHSLSAFYTSGSIYRSVGFFLLYSICSIGLSALMYFFFERPILALREKYVPKKQLS